MSKYGWSSNRDGVSPYGSMSGGAPAVTDEDFSYITSQDLDDPDLGGADGSNHRKNAAPNPDDDILLVKNKGVTYPAHFPAYSIGDGRLCVQDVKDRVGLMLDLSTRGTSRLKLLYKGRQLKEPSAPVRDYGVKDNSELMAVMPETDGASSPSEEEMVVVGDSGRDDAKSRRRKKKRTKKKTDKDDAGSVSSPPDSVSNAEPTRSPEPGARGMQQLDALATDLNTKWYPLCDKYMGSPPADPKKREEEHRRLSESLLQQVLKMDGVETDGVAEVRTRRREMVQQVQAVLKKLDGTARS